MGKTARVISPSATAITGMKPTKIMAMLRLMEKLTTMAAIIITGARTAIRMIMM